MLPHCLAIYFNFFFKKKKLAYDLLSWIIKIEISLSKSFE
jgi:F0F1-type ATP synthase assembly protein I